MSKYMFAAGMGKVSTRERARIDKVLAKFESYGASFSNPALPGDGPKFWFSIDNLGHGIDSRRAEEIMDAVGEVKIKK